MQFKQILVAVTAITAVQAHNGTHNTTNGSNGSDEPEGAAAQLVGTGLFGAAAAAGVALLL